MILNYLNFGEILFMKNFPRSVSIFKKHKLCNYAFAQKAAKLIFLTFLFIGIFLLNGYAAYAFSPQEPLRVGLVSRFSNRQSIFVDNTMIVLQGQFFYSYSGFTVRAYGSGHINLYGSSGRISTSDSLVIYDGAGSGMVSLDGREYRGGVEFSRLSGSGITAINLVSMEEYLLSVVPSEMPASWHLEALKAQAVAARTYALRTVRNSVHTGFDLCDGVHCQVYNGAGWEHENSSAAVMATAGLALFFNGELIDAVYSASSGGFTENSENVWLEARPYLRSVSDYHEFEPVIWTRSFTLAEITFLASQSGRNIGMATGVSISGFHDSGRVEQLIIHGTTGQIFLEKEEIRTFFARSEGGSLQSRIFTFGEPPAGQTGTDAVYVFDGQQLINTALSDIYVLTPEGVFAYQAEPQPPSARQLTASGNIITMHGRGFGHGVGLSQRGAEGMARRGYDFRRILTHFYTGVTIN